MMFFANDFSRLCWVCLILVTLIATAAPNLFLLSSLLHSCLLASLPSPTSSWPTPLPSAIPHGELPVLTAHILEEEEQTQDICGK